MAFHYVGVLGAFNNATSLHKKLLLVCQLQVAVVHWLNRPKEDPQLLNAIHPLSVALTTAVLSNKLV